MDLLLAQVAIFIVRRNTCPWQSYKNGDFSSCREGTVALMQGSCLGTITPLEKMGYNRPHVRKEGPYHTVWYLCNLDKAKTFLNACLAGYQTGALF